MRILIYGLNFAPEPTGIGKYTGEMAAWLARQGNEVRVIAAPPYYPSWTVSTGYSKWRSAKELWQGVQVWRSPLWVPAKPTGLKRVVHLLSFAIGSLPALLQQLPWRPEVVVVVAPALSCAPGGWAAARVCGAKSWLHIQDFEVDAAFRMGLLKNEVARRLLGASERWLLRRFDRVSTISSRMMDLLRVKGVSPSRVVSFPNWVDVGAILPLRAVSSYRAELGLPAGTVVALYSGSMAGKQGLELLPQVARTLIERLPNLVFVLCGDGVFKSHLEKASEDLPNVRFLPLQPLARLDHLLGLADIHLLPQHAEAADLVMPSKLTGMLSSGRPVIATAHAGTELANVVAGKGIVVPPNDVPALGAALIELVESEPMRKMLGAEARRYAENHLARDRVLVEFELALRRSNEAVAASRAEPAGSASSAETTDDKTVAPF